MRRFALLIGLVIVGTGVSAQADNFGSEENSFEIDFVSVGYAGNAADTDLWAQPTNSGAVAYLYRIGKYEISETMIHKANSMGGLGITIDSRGPNKPATSMSWFEAAKFVNWLNESTGHAPAYKFANASFELWQPGDAGYDENNLYRNRQAKYALPTSDEWYKAAYFDPASELYNLYPTGSGLSPDGVDVPGDTMYDAVFHQSSLGFDVQAADVTNAGVLSPIGTMGQGGNALEWEESPVHLTSFSDIGQRGYRGGCWSGSEFWMSKNYRSGHNPYSEGTGFGFRVVSVPEPSSFMLVLFAAKVIRRRSSPPLPPQEPPCP